MTRGNEVVVGSPDLRYIHHATTCFDLRVGLPVVDEVDEQAPISMC